MKGLKRFGVKGKLSPRYIGPFKIPSQNRGTAFELELPAQLSQVHNVFHVSQLKPFLPDHSPVFSDISTLVDLSAHDTAPECILDCRLVKKGNTAVPQVLIKWSKIPASSTTWEDYYVVKERFPSASDWGQAASQWGSCHTPPECANAWRKRRPEYVFVACCRLSNRASVKWA